jgi:hypothetical protein
LDQAADVVTDDLAQNLVHHRHICLAADVVAELGLYHREHGLDIAALVVVAKKFLAAVLEVVEHLFPQTAAVSGMDTLEGDIGNRAVLGDSGVVAETAVAFIGSHPRTLKFSAVVSTSAGSNFVSLRPCPGFRPP